MILYAEKSEQDVIKFSSNLFEEYERRARAKSNCRISVSSAGSHARLRPHGVKCYLYKILYKFVFEKMQKATDKKLN